MKSPFVSRESYEEALRRNDQMVEKLTAALAEARLKQLRISELEAQLAAIEPASLTPQERGDATPMGGGGRIRRIVTLAEESARTKAKGKIS